jgi:BirA family biotin operon repressor/biotin-[acetyl-CoA-carboxylase] ligase
MDQLEAALIDVPGVQVRIVERCASTNSILLAEDGTETVLLAAEAQTAGRGQRGRRWHSAPRRDVTFSLACRLRRPVRELGALSLVAGAAAASALRSLGVASVSLKWPNDLMAQGAKLGGILVETRPAEGGTRAVFGVGINCSSDPVRARRVRRAIVALDQFVLPSRNAVITCVARTLCAALERFEAEGFAAARAQWQALAVHAGQRLRVRLANGRTVCGIDAGVAPDGALRLLTRGRERTIHSGRIVSARAA